MTPDELEHGYAWIYERLFSHSSIWRRRPEDWSAVPLYLAMSYLYKRSNRLWHQLIKHDLVHGVWRPLVEMTRWRHIRYRQRLEREGAGRSSRPGRVGRGLAGVNLANLGAYGCVNLNFHFQLFPQPRKPFQPDPRLGVSAFRAFLNLTGIISHHAVISILGLP